MPQRNDPVQQNVRDERDQERTQEAVREAARQECKPCQQQPQQVLNNCTEEKEIGATTMCAMWQQEQEKDPENKTQQTKIDETTQNDKKFRTR